MPLDALPLALVLAGTSAGAVIDLRTRRLPHGLTLGLASAGFALAAAGAGRVSVPAACAGALLGFLLMLPGHLFGATGGGDVKLFAAAGTLLGPTATLWAFVFTAIAGGVLALLVAAHRGRVWQTLDSTSRLVFRKIQHPRADTRFAYAPAIAAGATLAAVFV